MMMRPAIMHQACRSHGHPQSVSCPSRCLNTVLRSSQRDATPASELQALVAQLARCEPTAKTAMLQEGELVDVVRALAAGESASVGQYAGDPQGMSALAQLLQPHASPKQQAALSAAAAAAAARPPQLSAQEEAMQLLQEPLVKTAFSRMRRDPGLGFSSYGQNPAVSKAMRLLQDVLSEDQHTRQVVEFMRSATAASAAAAAAAQAGKEAQQQRQQQAHEQQEPVVTGPVLGNNHHHQQRQRSPARTAVIARSASTHSTGSAGEGAAGRGPATNP